MTDTESSKSPKLREILLLPEKLSKSLRGHLIQRKSSKVTKKTSVNFFQAITAMKKGIQVWKLPHKHYLVGKAHICCLRLSRDEKYLYWYSHKAKSEVVLHLDQIVKLGCDLKDLPEEVKSWKGYCESLSFTLYFQSAGSGFNSPSTSNREGGGFGNVTFVCKNAVDHKIWTVTLQILLRVLDIQIGHVPGSNMEDKGLASLLPADMMKKEISQIARNFHRIIESGEKSDSREMFRTPSGLKFSASESKIMDSSTPEASASEADPSLSLLATFDPTSSTPVTGSVVSHPVIDRVIADTWVWGRGMDKVGKYVADQLYPSLLHGQKTLDAFQIACGEHHVVIIDELGSVYTWGFSDEGQLGHGAPVESFGPMQVKAFEGNVVTQVSCGTTSTIAITEKGEAFLWGHPMYSFAQPTWYPKPLDLGNHRIKQVSCGAYHFAMCTRDGKVLTCGGGKFGSLGHGSLDNCLKPRVVEALETAVTHQISCGIWHTAAVVKKDTAGAEDDLGEVYTWGDNSVGQLGYKDPKLISWPLYVENLKGVDIASVACGRHHTLALTSDGQLYSWGSNKFGQLGRRILNDGQEHFCPALLDFSGYAVTEIAAGMDHNLVIAQNNKESFLYSWGCGEYGCLGHGDSKSISLPKQIQSLMRKKIVRIACGANTSCAIIEHVFASDMERSDTCKNCLTKLKRNRKKACARCGVAYCKNCTKQFGLLRPLLPLTSQSNVKDSKHPLVCMECSGILIEAQFEAKFHYSAPQRHEKKPKQKKMISVDPERRVERLEHEIESLKNQIEQLQKEKELLLK